ncbi:MAG: HelD family protein [Acidimicrobiales bacterium]
MPEHPDLAAEQAYIDHAYECLEEARVSASRLESMVEVGPRGGTNQARFERDVIWDTILARLRELDIGDASLVFGRIDHEPADDNGRDGPRDNGTYYIGRIAVADPAQEPVVVDWRAPVAEPFYRATGRLPMGLRRRRHFATRGRTLLGIEDELFGEAAERLGVAAAERPDGVSGYSSLIAALETSRGGKLGDIVATIQAEQDEIIRSELAGVLVVQGGPGTGKTVVALHRAAYLLYTHRFPLEGQGVLVVGPNRLFLGYIDQVLPSLGEAGVELAVPADLIPDEVTIRGYDEPQAARVKGDLRMAKVLAKAVRDRRRPLRHDLVVGYGVQNLRLSVEESARIVNTARRRARTHNLARRFVESAVYEALAAGGRGEIDPGQVRERLHRDPDVVAALEWMWPVLTPAELLHDLFGSRALLGLAAGRELNDAERELLYRKRSATVDEVDFTHDDVPLLDEARALLGPRARRRSDEDALRTYGHIVVDEAQDLSPMQLRMLARRSLNGSMTVVGDIAQATGAWAHANWNEILDHLPRRRSPRIEELTIGYRIPEASMALAARVLAEAAPELAPPRSVRHGGDEPRIVRAASTDALPGLVAEVAADELGHVGAGNVAIIAPGSLVDDVGVALEAAGIPFGQANRHGLDKQVTIVPIRLAKGLELDAAVVVEPTAIVEEEAQGLRALYVALTRATRRLAVVHAGPLPAAIAE